MANPDSHASLIHKCLSNHQWHTNYEQSQNILRKVAGHTETWYQTRKRMTTAFFIDVLSLFKISVWHHWPAALTHNISVILSLSCPVDRRYAVSGDMKKLFNEKARTGLSCLEFNYLVLITTLLSSSLFDFFFGTISGSDSDSDSARPGTSGTASACCPSSMWAGSSKASWR